MKRKGKIIGNICAWCLLCAVALLSVFYAYPALTSEKETKNNERPVVLSLWHIDTFEGGKGSRANFLKNAATAFGKEKRDCVILVSDYTAAGAKAAFESGKYPDLLSFGIGFDADPALFIPFDDLFFSGGTGTKKGKSVAYPWCAGAYAVFSRSGDFSRLSADTVIVSKGGGNLAETACALHLGSGAKKIADDGNSDDGETAEKRKSAIAEDSLAAYVDFLNGKREYLFGTQRDLYRFAARGTEIHAQAAQIYNDLYQYIGVLNCGEATGEEAENQKTARRFGRSFVSYLLAEKVQSTLDKIGMFSLSADIYGADTGAGAMESALQGKNGKKIVWTANVFMSEATRKDAEKFAADGEIVQLKKFLKSV